MNLPKFRLSRDADRGDWKLTDALGQVVRRWPDKSAATAAGELRRAVGWGTVLIEAAKGGVQDERSYRQRRNWIAEYLG